MGFASSTIRTRRAWRSSTECRAKRVSPNVLRERASHLRHQAWQPRSTASNRPTLTPDPDPAQTMRASIRTRTPSAPVSTAASSSAIPKRGRS